jgi:hypothetical protein
MRPAAIDGLRTLRAGLAALALLALGVSAASAQLVYDGNLFWQNNATGTLAGQFSGAPTGASTCAVPGLNAAFLGTTTYTHNLYADPLLPNAPYVTNSVPDFQPALGSPAYGSTVTVPSGFFVQTCYRGAIGPNAGDDWTQGWTYWDSTGANRQDLHLAGMPSPRPLAIYNNISITGAQYFSPDSNYEVRGQLRVKAGGSLTVAPGVVILEDVATLGTIVVERGARIHAIGSACDPIVITSNSAPGTQAAGDVGGLYLLGRGKVNVVNSCAGDSTAAEGGAIGYYGGNDDNDSSGELRYVRVEYAGKEITANNELNSFTFCGVGRNTRADYLQAFNGDDDGFEWFGGTSDQTHLIAIDGHDDGYDTQLGTRNRAQFVIVRVSPMRSKAGTQNGERGIEADNNEFNFGEVQCAGRSNVVVANFTMVGDKRVGSLYPGATQGAQLRRGTGYTILNSIIFNFKSMGIAVSDDGTWDAHCAAAPVGPTVACGPGGNVGVTPIGAGRVFVAQSLPNPFRDAVNIAFSLPESAPVTVEIYSADGRRVQTLANGVMGAGPHVVTWKLERAVPSGVYFYQVVAGDHRSTGKFTRLD